MAPRHRTTALAPHPVAAPAVSGGIKDYMKIGFGLGLGSSLAYMILIFFAMLLFIPGFIIVYKQNKLPKEARSTGWMVFGFILMGLGMILGLGFGAGAFFGLLGDSMGE